MNTTPRSHRPSIASTQGRLEVGASGVSLVPWIHEKPPEIREIALEHLLPTEFFNPSACSRKSSPTLSSAYLKSGIAGLRWVSTPIRLSSLIVQSKANAV
jgi:hypothetical protein